MTRKILLLLLLLVAFRGANAQAHHGIVVDTTNAKMKKLLSLITFDTTGMRKTPILPDDLALISMTFTPSEEYSVSDNIHLVYVSEEKENPLWRLGMVHAILTHRDGQCKIAAYVAGADNVRYGRMLKDNPLTGKISMTKYNRIKSDLRYGKDYAAASKQEIEDLKMMMTFYPRDTAQALFNADEMLVYPFNMEGKAYETVFTRTRVVVAEKNGLELFLYLILTDRSIERFDEYFSGIKGMFQFD
ncbi:MAG: hypothetical protein LBP56_10500 [Odoribacteraceae bacterium]|jgi:hypothetical protein|nr:hypothetical protein [Odoribacteraceae bacterium]